MPFVTVQILKFTDIVLYVALIFCYSTYSLNILESTVTMSKVVKSVLEEELQRLLILKDRYQEKMKEYPPGYLLKRKMRGRVYYYLSYREGAKIRQRYLGPLEPEKLKSYKDLIKRKKELQKQFSEVKKNIAYLERLLKK